MERGNIIPIVALIIALLALTLATYAIFVLEDEENEEDEGEIPNKSPMAKISVTNTTVDENTTVNFDASESTDSDGTIVEYKWNFGDGTEGTGVTVNHLFESSGSYIVVLTVYDEDDASHIDTITITVKSLTPAITTPIGYFSFSESASTPGIYFGALAAISDEVLISEASITIIDDSTGQSTSQDPLLNNTPIQVGAGLKLTYTDSNANGKLDSEDVWKAEKAESGDQIRLIYRPTGELIASYIIN